jgi:hypothetical protein
MDSHMGTAAPPSGAPQHSHAEDPDKIAGWLIFAGTMVLIAGILNVIYGIAGIGNANWLEANTAYVFSSMKTWGWIVLIVGVLQLTAAFSIWAGNEYGRWIGIGSAALNSIVMLMFIPRLPVRGAGGLRARRPRHLRPGRIRRTRSALPLIRRRRPHGPYVNAADIDPTPVWSMSAARWSGASDGAAMRVIQVWGVVESII